MGIVGDGGFGGGSATKASMAVNKSSVPRDVVILEGETADATVVHSNILVVDWDFKFW